MSSVRLLPTLQLPLTAAMLPLDSYSLKIGFDMQTLDSFSHHPANSPRALGAEEGQAYAEWNRIVRRFRHYKDESEWIHTMLEAAIGFVPQAAVFSVQNDKLLLRAQLRLSLPDDLSFFISSAHAFAGAVVSKEPIVALRASGEVTEALSSTDPSARAYLMPILNGPRVVAVLFGAGMGPVDLNALEMICGIASMALERQSNASLAVQLAPKTSAVAPSRPPGTSLLLSRLPEDERRLHLRAQRFSRVKVAEMQLLRPDACRTGREQNDVYLFLKKEIDAARKLYQNDFMILRSMTDYLHRELVHAVTDGDESKLGANYPGELE